MTRSRIAAILLALASFLPVASAAFPLQNPFAARPRPEHALLKKLAGEWKATFRMTMPGAPPIESRASEVNEMLGELWIVSRYDDSSVMAFSGAQLFGYDSNAKEYVAAWVDSQSTELSVQKGAYDEATKTLTLRGTGKDPMSGADSSVRTVVKLEDDDHRTQQMFVGGPGGKEMQMFMIEYERVK